MAASRLKDELEELQQELAALAEQGEEARRHRAERRQAAIDRYQAIGETVRRRTKQISPFILLAAVAVGVIIGRHLMKKTEE